MPNIPIQPVNSDNTNSYEDWSVYYPKIECPQTGNLDLPQPSAPPLETDQIRKGENSVLEELNWNISENNKKTAIYLLKGAGGITFSLALGVLSMKISAFVLSVLTFPLIILSPFLWQATTFVGSSACGFFVSFQLLSKHTKKNWDLAKHHCNAANQWRQERQAIIQAQKENQSFNVEKQSVKVSEQSHEDFLYTYSDSQEF